LPTPLCAKLSTRPFAHSETDRTMGYPPSRSLSSDHHTSKSSDDILILGGAPPGAAYHTSSSHDASNMLRLSHPSFPTVPDKYRFYSRSDSSHDPRISRHPDIEQMSTHESQPAGSSTMDRSRQEISASSSSVAKYECSYCGKGFNRPSSLKVRSSSTLSLQSVTAQLLLDPPQQSHRRKT
jgi:hypothetical protein